MAQNTEPPSRRHVLESCLWAGAGLLWTVSGRRPRLISHRFNPTAARTNPSALSFVQISDSHIGFNKVPIPDAAATLKTLPDCLSATTPRPAFVLHTGNVSHLSRDTERDMTRQFVKEMGIETHFILGEHDPCWSTSASYSLPASRHKLSRAAGRVFNKGECISARSST